MTFGVEQHGQHRRLLVALVLAVLALVVGVGVSVDAHATSPGGQVAGTAVAAHDHLADAVVAASEDVLAGEGRGTTTLRLDVAIGSRVAPNTAGARFVAGSDGVVTDLVGAAPNAVSIGHYPAYVNAGARTGARTFSMSDEAWNAMSPTEQWVRNQR